MLYKWINDIGKSVLHIFVYQLQYKFNRINSKYLSNYELIIFLELILIFRLT